MRFLGYDPGGKGAHGVACLNIVDGSTSLDPSKVSTEAGVISTPDAALEWFFARIEGAVAVGVDTLLMWTTQGRQCDSFLRREYKIHPGTVQSMGSLRGAMLGNGVIVTSKLGLPAFEANPKAALISGVLDPYRYIWADLPNDPDHARDATIGATCAALSVMGVWRSDLYEGEPDPFFPAGHAKYPWPVPTAV